LCAPVNKGPTSTSFEARPAGVRPALDVLTVECDKCGRFGRYHIDRLIERYGIDAKLFEWEPEADCPRKIARNDYDPCGARCPDLSKLV